MSQKSSVRVSKSSYNYDIGYLIITSYLSNNRKKCKLIYTCIMKEFHYLPGTFHYFLVLFVAIQMARLRSKVATHAHKLAHVHHPTRSIEWVNPYSCSFTAKTRQRA
jgi:hypothetical protein